MGRESQTKTVLFADVTESSRLYNQLGDVAARNAINGSLAALVDLLPRYKGRLDKTLGDAVMCVFPDAANGVAAARDMQRVIADEVPGGHPIRMHIGLHAGPVIIDNDDVFGDTVNAAAFLTNAAMADQILLSEATEQALPQDMKACVRPLFRSVLKGSTEESAIFQVLWRDDNLELTDVNLMASRVLPADAGSLVVELGQARARVDRWHPLVSMGRDLASDISMLDQFASRKHCSIRLTRSSFYLVDHSVNGTYVTFASGEEVHLLRGEIVLEGSGEIRLGRSREEVADSTIIFRRDRRSAYRP